MTLRNLFISIYPLKFEIVQKGIFETEKMKYIAAQRQTLVFHSIRWVFQIILMENTRREGSS